MKRGLKLRPRGSGGHRSQREGTFPDEEGTEICTTPPAGCGCWESEGTFPDEEGTEMLLGVLTHHFVEPSEGTFPDEEGTEMGTIAVSGASAGT